MQYRPRYNIFLDFIFAKHLPKLRSIIDMQVAKHERPLWDDAKFAKPSGSAEQLTGAFAGKLLSQAGLLQYPLSKPLVVFDNACGTGIVTQTLQEALSDRPADTFEVTCGDFADAMVQTTTQRISSAGWTNTSAHKIDAQDTKLPSDHFTHILTNFGPMLFPDASAMLSECNRMLKSDGVCAYSTWKKVGWIDDFKAAMASMPDIPSFPTEEKFASAFSKGRWSDEDYIREEMLQHGFTNIRIEAVHNTSIAKDAESLRANLAPITAIVYKFWTEEEREKFANKETESRIEKWFEAKYKGGPVSWDWIALLTTSNKAT